ncbi:MAG: hypothetical protein Q4B15_08565, partial [Lachnospiraceae bacterium]|nr:hypothetical protein [Lachnospiraceae bacterium]
KVVHKHRGASEKPHPDARKAYKVVHKHRGALKNPRPDARAAKAGINSKMEYTCKLLGIQEN